MMQEIVEERRVVLGQGFIYLGTGRGRFQPGGLALTRFVCHHGFHCIIWAELLLSKPSWVVCRLPYAEHDTALLWEDSIPFSSYVYIICITVVIRVSALLVLLLVFLLLSLSLSLTHPLSLRPSLPLPLSFLLRNWMESGSFCPITWKQIK